MVVEKVINFVFRAIDAFDMARQRFGAVTKNSKSTTAPSISVRSTKKRSPAAKANKKTRDSAELRMKEGESAHSLKNVTVTKNLVPTLSGRKIRSDRAEQIWKHLQNKNAEVISQTAEVDGKKSLAWVMWALGTADQTQLNDGISVHDVSALLYHAAKIEIYPINVSRMVHDHTHYIQQVSQEKRTKRYLLTEEGKKSLSNLSVSNTQR